MNFLGQGFRKLEQYRHTDRHTDRCHRTYYQAALAGGRYVCRYRVLNKNYLYLKRIKLVSKLVTDVVC